MAEITVLSILEPWVYEELSSDTVSAGDEARVLNDIDTLESHPVDWKRPLTNCVDVLSNTAGETVYRRRFGDIRTYFPRDCETLSCIGVGKRKTTDDRDLDQILDRASELRSNE